MKIKIVLLTAAAFAVTGIAFLTIESGNSRAFAQQADTPKMPEVVTMGKDVKLGPVTFSHVKHNGGEYKVGDAAIGCTVCHHTAQPASEITKQPGMKTVWPADRTTSLTSDLFAKDPKAAGVAACRDCHAKAGEKPKLLEKIPDFTPAGASAPVQMNNMQALHKNCAGCHTEVKKSVPTMKGPTQTQCMLCHKKAA